MVHVVVAVVVGMVVVLLVHGVAKAAALEQQHGQETRDERPTKQEGGGGRFVLMLVANIVEQGFDLRNTIGRGDGSRLDLFDDVKHGVAKGCLVGGIGFLCRVVVPVFGDDGLNLFDRGAGVDVPVVEFKHDEGHLPGHGSVVHLVVVGAAGDGEALGHNDEHRRAEQDARGQGGEGLQALRVRSNGREGREQATNQPEEEGDGGVCDDGSKHGLVPKS